MKLAILGVLFIALGFAAGFHEGKSSADKGWSHRTLTGLAVDCYDSHGNLIKDTWGEQFGAVRTSCGVGEIAKIHQAH